MRFHTAIFSVVVLVLLILSEYASAGSIHGIIRNSQSGKPIADVMVELEGSGRSTFTDSSGYFSFDTVAAGSWNLHCLHQKTEPLTLNDIFVSGDAIKNLTIEMNPSSYTLEKMVVKGHSFRKAPDMASSTKLMSFDEILRSPGALIDVQRAVQDLPSVSSAADNTNEIIVRGGTAGENLFMMDNMEIPNPNHFASQGSGGGVISLINPFLVKGLTFSAGAPPAQYGGKASSVLDVKLKDGNDKLILGGIDIGIAGVGGHIEGPLWSGCTFMASATKSFLDIVAHYADISALPEYWGVQSKVTQKLGNHRLYANLILGNNEIHIADALEEAGCDGQEIRAKGFIYAAGMSLESSWTDLLSTTLTVSGTGNSFDRSEYTDTTVNDCLLRDTFFNNQSVEREQQIKLQGALNLPSEVKIQAGINVKRCDADIEIEEKPDTVRDLTGGSHVYTHDAQEHEVGYTYGAFCSGIFRTFENVKIIPGVRADWFTLNKSFTVSPRLGLTWSLTPVLDITASGGMQYQEPDYADLLADPQNRSMKPKRATTAIAGVEYLIEKFSIKCIAEMYYKHYNNLPIEQSLLTSELYDQSDVLLTTGKGRSYGVELFAQKKLVKNLFFTVSYSLSKAEQRDFRPGFHDTWIRSDFDYRHVATISGGYKFELLEKAWYKSMHDKLWLKMLSPIFPLADRIEISAKWRYLGGRPRTVHYWSDQYYCYIVDPARYNRASYDDYHRLDIRFERRYGFGLLHMMYYFDFQNVYNKKNIWTYIYSDKNKKEKKIYQLPFFPAGGVIIGF
ncbi:MAG TPA: TonB-dependent receptor [Chitinispirillaceae bacterium]|nr:TonB-dependent receptor [Chitinispirillaceae bacterium]